MQKDRNSIASKAIENLTSAGLRLPKTLTLALTGACNLKCSHCWVDAGLSSSAAPVPEATVRRIMEEFASLGGEGFRFTGGEPLCHPHWQELIGYARDIGFAGLGLQTNGMLFGDKDISMLRRIDFPGLSLQISLDGATAKTHDLVRGEGAFRGTLEGIRRLAIGGLAPRIIIAFTEMRHNLEEIPAVLELAEGLGVGSVVAGSVVLCGRAAADSPVAPPRPDQYARLLQRYDTDPGFRECYDKIGNVAALEWRKGEAPRSECCTFAENPYLTSRGLLYPCVLCHADDFAVSAVFEKKLALAFDEGVPLWSPLLRISRRRTVDIPQCHECPGRLACAGGCMGRAWGSCGDLLAADDRCEVRRMIYRLKELGNPPDR